MHVSGLIHFLAASPGTAKDDERHGDRFDRAARRVVAALGGAILGASVAGIAGDAVGYHTLLVQLAGAAAGFALAYPLASRAGTVK